MSYNIAPEVNLPEPCEDINEVIEQLEKLWIVLGLECIDKGQLNLLSVYIKVKHTMHDPGSSIDIQYGIQNTRTMMLELINSGYTSIIA